MCGYIEVRNMIVITLPHLYRVYIRTVATRVQCDNLPLNADDLPLSG